MHWIVLPYVVAATTLASQLPVFAQPLSADPTSGRQLATKLCSSCHRVLPMILTDKADPPSFQSIADLPSTTGLSLNVFLHSNHKNMPNIILYQTESDDLIAYMLSLKKNQGSTKTQTATQDQCSISQRITLLRTALSGTDLQDVLSAFKPRATECLGGARLAILCAGQLITIEETVTSGWNWLLSPIQFLIIKADFDGWLDHGKIGRDVEVAWSIQRRVADVKHLLPRMLVICLKQDSPRNRKLAQLRQSK